MDKRTSEAVDIVVETFRHGARKKTAIAWKSLLDRRGFSPLEIQTACRELVESFRGKMDNPVASIAGKVNSARVLRQEDAVPPEAKHPVTLEEFVENNPGVKLSPYLKRIMRRRKR